MIGERLRCLLCGADGCVVRFECLAFWCAIVGGHKAGPKVATDSELCVSAKVVQVADCLLPQ